MTPETFVVIQAVSTVLSTFFFAGRLVADVKYRLGSRNLAYVASLILAGIAWIIGLEGGITNLWWGFRILRQPEDNGELIIWNIGLPPDKTDSYWRVCMQQYSKLLQSAFHNNVCNLFYFRLRLSRALSLHLGCGQ